MTSLLISTAKVRNKYVINRLAYKMVFCSTLFIVIVYYIEVSSKPVY